MASEMQTEAVLREQKREPSVLVSVRVREWGCESVQGPHQGSEGTGREWESENV